MTLWSVSWLRPLWRTMWFRRCLAMRQPTRLVRVSCQHHAGPRSGARSRSHKFGRVLVEADPPARAFGGPVAIVNEEPLTGANGQKEEAASFFSWSESSCHGSSAAMGSNCALGKQWSRDYPIPVTVTPTLPDANLRYQEALQWRKWTKGRCSFVLWSAQI